MDFRDLNKVYPKGSYLLPCIDQLGGSTIRHQLISTMDAYQEYHRISLVEANQNKVSFIIANGTFCYVIMSFGLKNARATYQRLMDKVFAEQLRHNVEVSVNDILVKSLQAANLVLDLEDTFTIIKGYDIKLT